MWSSMGQHMGQLSREAASAGKVSHGALDCPTDLGRPKVREIRDLTPYCPTVPHYRDEIRGTGGPGSSPVPAGDEDGGSMPSSEYRGQSEVLLMSRGPHTLYDLSEIADALHYTGADRERSVRRIFARHGIAILRRDRRTFLVTEQQYAALLEAIKCSPSAGEADSGTSVVRSVSVAKAASSKNTLRAAIERRMPRRTARGSKRTSGGKCFTVLAGGRSG